MADTDADPANSLAEMGNHRANAIIAGMTAALFQAYTAGREIDLVMQDNHVFWRQFVELGDLGESAAGLIVEGLRLDEQRLDAVRADKALRNLAFEF